MVIYEDKTYTTNSLFPNTDWTGKAKFIVEDGCELCNKIRELYPYYEFVLNEEGKLIDVIATEKPPEPKQTPQQKREEAYETMLYKEDKTPLILWEGEAITVDVANKKWLGYTAEGEKGIVHANNLTALISNAKTYIRNLYTDNPSD